MRQRLGQFDQHDVGHERPAVLVGMRVEHRLGALGLRFVVAGDEPDQDVGVERDHLRARRLRAATAGRSMRRL